MDQVLMMIAILYIAVVVPITIMVIALQIYYNKYINKNYLCRKCHSAGVFTYITKAEHDAHDGNCKNH
jgi:hypothetical protein